MVGNINIIINKLSKKTGKPVEYYQDISTYLFDKMKYELQEGLEGGLILREIGTWSVDGYHLRYMIGSTIRKIRELRIQDDARSVNALKRYYEKLRYLLKLRNIMSHYYVEHKKPYEIKKRNDKFEKNKEHILRESKALAEDQARLLSKKVGLL